MLLDIIREWRTNLKYYAQVEASSSHENGDPTWRSYMENNNMSLGGSFRFISRGVMKRRVVLILFLLMNAISLYMLSATNAVFDPELSWTCLEEAHSGITKLCRSFSERTPRRRSAICIMELDMDYVWNFTFTKTPMIEFNAFCPLQRSVEPKLVNMLGSICGSLVGGIFIDSLGRKNMSLICVFFSILTELSYRVCTNVIMYTYQEFIKGVFTSVAAMSILTWGVELSRPRFTSAVVCSFFVCSSLGSLITTAITKQSLEWRMVIVILSCVGFGLLPLIFFVPSSLRYMVARGKTKGLPTTINFKEGAIQGSRAKDCLSRPQTNRLYGINAVFLVMAGYSAESLIKILSMQHKELDLFQKAALVEGLMLVGHLVALFVALLPVLKHIIHVSIVVVAGILAILATSTNYSDSFWSLARVFTGVSLLLIALSVALTFTAIKQIPTLNRAFFVSGLNAAFMLGSLLSVIIESWCLKKDNETSAYCLPTSEDTRLLISGCILLISVAPAFLNTCLARNVNLPHSYRELNRSTELRSGTRDMMELMETTANGTGNGTKHSVDQADIA